MTRRFLSSISAAALAATTATPAFAGVATFIGADNRVESAAQMVNSNAAAVAFNSAAPDLTLIDFESAVPGGVTITGGQIADISTASGYCGALCGFNTTAGGANFLYLNQTATFTFADPINAFGFFVTGLQTDQVRRQTVRFNDGSLQTIMFPQATNGGGAFIGFTDLDQLITSVTINVNGDATAIDDVRFGWIRLPSGVPSRRPG